jgi:EPSP synthase (3-phosphoshikimate 1-carboxyvinyltransferase)
VAEKIITPARAINGSVALPGDKSISHRYAILAALAEGASELRGGGGLPEYFGLLAPARRRHRKI